MRTIISTLQGIYYYGARFYMNIVCVFSTYDLFAIHSARAGLSIADPAG